MRVARDRCLEGKTASYLTTCGAGIVSRTQLKLEPGRGASDHLVADERGPISTHPRTGLDRNPNHVSGARVILHL